MAWIKQNQDGTYEYSKWEPSNPSGYTECSEENELFQSYATWKENLNTSDDKDVKIDLKIKIDAGNSLGLDMSAEEAELTALIG